MSEESISPESSEVCGQSFRHLDWRLVAVMLIGSAVLPLHHTVTRSRAFASVPWAHGWSFEIVYGVLPFLALLVLGYRPWRYLLPGRFREVAPAFFGFTFVVLASCVWLAGLDSWRGYYSGIALSSVTWTFVLWPVWKMIAGEFFFRGFLVFPLYERLGWYALPIGALPYTLFHLNKPAIEIYGSMVFGIVLGYLAIRSASIWYGVAIHWLLNVAIPIAIGLRS